MFAYLKSNGIRVQSGVKQPVYVRKFCELMNIELPTSIKGKGFQKWLNNLYFSPESKYYVPAERNYTSQVWNNLKKKVFKKYGYKCMKCGDIEKEMHVDHIKPYSFFPELSTDFNNLQVLCITCNISKGNRSQIDYRPVTNNLVNFQKSIVTNP